MASVISKTPLRLPLGGGGTDLPFYYESYGAEFISVAINKFIYVAVTSEIGANTFRIYEDATVSDYEQIADIPEGIHRAVLELFPTVKVGIHSFSDIPSGTGLGSSGSFIVGFINALSTLHGDSWAPVDLAESSCEIEMHRLRRPVGKQDQYIAAFGGVRHFCIDREGHVSVRVISMPPESLKSLRNYLVMYYTGIRRNSAPVLERVARLSTSDHRTQVEKLHEIKLIGREIISVLEKNDTLQLGRLMHEHWEIKRSMTRNPPEIDKWYNLARSHGAVGGKIMGAGEGGMFLFVCPPAKQPNLDHQMRMEGLIPIDFDFYASGSEILVQS
ncbi:D-glycero-alpha-D-manno-heptose-7-phosphate kinase [Sulfobacillus thermosulfidooxidans DSM 9293]|uniref:mevalonate kinase n=1 Tax=Sulfobacillus thermosulfidooxidans (strain DSM 9293 / VKM B-1269 / AT-1) TaxID=929705 RepID=A0A1W1WNY6_SULTA|nr:hypothetical protein [Sulfobacillus thermosulfidooxidans]SMC07919.1 D-glycero-alpha-D-manno-heptose-7-phosphate kinase [Sulfobacillus thermosulfidooxidans DSM 9293]